MQVWENIKEEAAKENVNFETVEKVREWMYANRVIPCDIEDQFKIISDDVKHELCIRKSLDCFKCLEEYLKIEI